ncbi:MAG: YhcH/YjgK/YiaL family protein [Lachnospiraceae bacterium]|nr:YhcH/YjgK/YiaL family protein [Lachnospiraceae bacterium]
MIYDKLSNLNNYKGISKNLDKAIQFISSNDLNKLPLGKTSVDGDLVYINVMETKAQPLEERRYEVHKNYMDIQIDLVGTERIDTGDCHNVTLEDYNQESDAAFADSEFVASCIVGPGNFVICMAREPHKPNIQVTEDTYLKKAVCKVHI